VATIINAIRRGGLFSVDMDILPTQIGETAHVVLPPATTGEMNLTSMNGERRLRLSEKYMDAPGEAKPDCIIAARLANALEASFRKAGNEAWASKFNGFDWKTEEDAFMDGYHKHANGGKFVTYDRLRAMGTNGVQEPMVNLAPRMARRNSSRQRGVASIQVIVRRRRIPIHSWSTVDAKIRSGRMPSMINGCHLSGSVSNCL